MNANPQHITSDIDQAAQWLQQGKLLAYPTESVWGIGCDPYNKQAVSQILAIKNRPIEKGMIVVTDSIDRIKPLLMQLSKTRRQQVIESWQQDNSTDFLSNRQANTWLLPLSTSDADCNTEAAIIPKWITGAHDSVAVRVISHPLIQKLCQNRTSKTNPYGFIVSTSCNPSQLNPATSFEQAYDYFADSIFYLQGATLGYTLPSQIRDARSGVLIR
ncbi:Sua5/YciO/YrdC/YwlC family protein [Psychrobacter sp.]|uniref:L-threonylcarbamoyladenylate synthase n=1 Tax=Psychrobacter sp. TaxID=56811 RepID=UPI0025F1D373|nr:Sua5/YciO/YrdC/YwlC family protein [Psychrobacter sp.]